MCIIITKESSAKPLPEEIFETIWDNNPNGGGILYHDGKRATLKKGIMTKKEFLEEAKKVNKKGIAYIMHTRIATHGPVIPENTHPFVSKTLGFAHNGMFNLEPLPQKTDSESFFEWTIADKTFEWCEENKFLLDMATDGCRCAIMDLKTGRIMHLCEEDWKTNKAYNGYKFSNESYKERPSYTRYSSYSGGTNHIVQKGFDRYDDLDDWDDDYNYTTPGFKYDPQTNTFKNVTGKIDSPRFNTENVNLMSMERDKNKDLTFEKTWVQSYLEMYAEKTQKVESPTEAEKKKNLMLTTLRLLREEVKESEKYYGVKDVITQAAMLIKSFYHEAYNLGYYDEKQVNAALESLIKDTDVETKEEQDIIKELETTRREYV